MQGSKLELHVSQDENVVSDEQQEQTEFLKHQLKVRDQLVDQLSAQLFQMVQDHPPALPQGRPSNATDSTGEIQSLQRQISFYQDQIDQRDQQIAQLKSSCQGLRDRNQMLENVVKELPEVYRQQFAERLDQFKEKMQALKAENQRLRNELGIPPKNSSGQAKRRLFLPSQKQG